MNNPAAPTLLGSYSTPDKARGVHVVGTTAYIADGDMHLVEVSNPAAPTLLGSYNTPGDAYSVQVVGSIAYLADRESGLLVVDVGNPAAPTLISSYDTPGMANDVQVVGNTVYIADLDGGLQILGITETPDPPTTVPPTTVPTDTPPPTTVPTDTPTPTPIPTDSYEPDDTCPQARSISADGTIQQHTLTTEQDEDWARLNVISGTNYLIEARVGPDSPADLVLELYEGGCDEEHLTTTQDHHYTPEIHHTYTYSGDGTVYLRVSQTGSKADTSFFDADYTLSVRSLHEEIYAGALIIVVQDSGDALKDNLHKIASNVKTIFKNKYGYTDRITYLGNLDKGADLTPTRAHLEEAIAGAKDDVGANRPLTLYLVGHGKKNRFILDASKSDTEYVTPGDLDTWLSALEDQFSYLEVNIIIDSCYAGSFIEPFEKVSGPWRMVIASTGPDNLAWASNTEIIFSSHFFTALKQGGNLQTCFDAGRNGVEAAGYSMQTPWLDGNGNGEPNEDEDYAEAKRRAYSFGGIPGTLPLVVNTRPYIEEVEAPAVVFPEVGNGVIRARVLDDDQIVSAWAVIYPPSYQPPEGEGIVDENLDTVMLLPQKDNWRGGEFSNFREPGRYRVVVHAVDNEGAESYAQTLEVWVGRLYLPLVTVQPPVGPVYP